MPEFTGKHDWKDLNSLCVKKKVITMKLFMVHPFTKVYLPTPKAQIIMESNDCYYVGLFQNIFMHTNFHGVN